MVKIAFIEGSKEKKTIGLFHSFRRQVLQSVKIFDPSNKRDKDETKRATRRDSE